MKNAETLGLTGKEIIDVHIDENVKPRDIWKVTATDEAGNKKEFEGVLVRSILMSKLITIVMVVFFNMVLRDKLQA